MTYKKYNSGSLKGEYLCLGDYNSYEEFIEREEKDIELMFSDVDTRVKWIDQFISKSYTPPELLEAFLFYAYEYYDTRREAIYDIR